MKVRIILDDNEQIDHFFKSSSDESNILRAWLSDWCKTGVKEIEGRWLPWRRVKEARKIGAL